MHVALFVWLAGGFAVAVIAAALISALTGRHRHDLGYVSGQWIAQHRSAEGYDG